MARLNKVLKTPATTGARTAAQMVPPTAPARAPKTAAPTAHSHAVLNGPGSAPAQYVLPGFDLGSFMLRSMDSWSGYAFAAVDPTGGLVLYSRRMGLLTGYTPDEVLERGFLALLFPSVASRAKAASALSGFVAGEAQNHVFHWTIQRKDGGKRTVWANSVALTDTAGARSGVFMSFRDVTEYPGVLGYDRATQRGFEELVESAPDILVRFRVDDGRCVYINRVVERVTGLAPQAFYREADLFRRLIVAEERPAFDGALVAAGRGETHELEYHWRIGERQVRLSHKLYPIKDDAGSVFAIEGIVRDLSGQRALEARLNQILDEKEAVNVALQARMRELESANEKLRSLDRLKSEILANVSHELRTPLVTICGYAELLLDGGLGGINGKQRQALEVVQRSGRRLSTLIENMLEFAKLEEGRVVLRRHRLDLRECATEVADEIAGRLSARSIRFTLEVPPAPVTVLADRLRLLLLLRNLLGNAEKFTDPGGRVTLAVSTAEGSALVVVRDTGVGIASEFQGKVFERFFQVDGSAARRHGGTGLGLAIVREVVEMHGGNVKLVSALGKGARFEIRLPLAPRKPSALAARAAGQRPRYGRTRSESRRQRPRPEQKV